MIGRTLVLCGAMLSLGAAPREDSLSTLRSGIEYLMSQQGEDGGWHSETYGSMRQGAAITSLVLYALSHAPPAEVERHRESIARACEFLRVGFSKKGFVANQDGSADFPTYATSLLLIASSRIELPLSEKERRTLAEFVAAAQLTQTREFGPDSIHHGGWDLMGAQRIIGQTSGTNVSISRIACEALAVADGKKYRPNLQRARVWAERIQDLSTGGFYFTPDANSNNNKALGDKDEDDAIKPRPYGTASCDGLLLLIATGVKTDHPRVAGVIKWLAKHSSVEAVPGFRGKAKKTGWQDGLRFYYYSALSASLEHLPPELARARARAMASLLAKQQFEDGRWMNSSDRMRENDPLIATSFAVIALGYVVSR